jgi:hypothetical protein
MATILIGIVVLALLLVAAKTFVVADPQRLIRVMKIVGGVGALGGGALVASRGFIVTGAVLGLTGLRLLGWLPWFAPGFYGRTQKSPGQVSRVRTAFLEMELDHDTGNMRGRILSGAHEGADLDTLDAKTLIALLVDVDEESRALLMAYLDRKQPAWRDDMEPDAAAGKADAGWKSGEMTDEEARQILGVQPGASAEEIGHAHRTLMKKLHPDQGGSTYLAARVNQAKDVLLRRDR